jgi:2-oxoisovalerate dehydrogenase E1 component
MVQNNLEKRQVIQLYKNMLLSRLLDEKMLILLKQGKSFFHIGAPGHEAVQTAAAYSMKAGDDFAYPYYRDQAFVLQFGVNVDEILMNFLAKDADPSSGGRQLPQHYGNRKLNLVSQSSPTGTQYLQAVGTALAMKKKNSQQMVYVSSGEGATSQGDFHEALNWASRASLPVLFVIQNNKYAISTHISQQTSGQSIYKFTAGYEGLTRYQVDGTDLFESYSVMQQAITKLRAGAGPVLIEAHTVRLMPHSSSDSHNKYRKKEDLQKDKAQDPIMKLEARMIQDSIADESQFMKIKKEIKEIVDDAADRVQLMENPTKKSLHDFVFAPDEVCDKLQYEKNAEGAERAVMVDAINHALKEEMRRNEDIYLFGEDVADNKGGVFTTTSGISTMFGDERCFNAPLAESSIVGVAIGMAVYGLRPVVEIQFGDYIWTAMMQIRNELTTMRWRSANSWQAAVVMRVPVGGYIHGALCHSQNIEAFFAHIPGLKIAYPSNSNDAKGLLKTAIRCDDPVLFLEHKALYRQSYAAGAEPDEEYLLPFGKARLARKGEHVTVITWGYLVQKSIEAAKSLQREGVEVEVVDIRTIVPLDMETIINSIRKTGKVIVVHEDTLFAGFGAEIAAQIGERAFEYLDGPVRRLGAADTPVPYSPVLEEEMLPQQVNVTEAIRKLAQY